VRDVLVGLLQLLVLLTLMLGSFNRALELLAVSSLCTAGIGAAFWFAVAYVLGAASLYVLVQLIRPLGWPQPEALRPSFGSGSSHTGLRGYVERRRRAGGDDDHIRADLLRGGWSPSEVEAALAAAGPGDAP
jgi:hypothetical protein